MADINLGSSPSAARSATAPTVTEAGLLTFAASDLALLRLQRAEQCLARAQSADSATTRFAAAQLAATRAGAAVLAVTGKPARGEAARNMWLALIKKAPQFTGPAQRFAAAAELRRDIINGLPPRLSDDDAATLCVAARDFVAEVEEFVCAA